jgi:hypothetical protein
MFYEDQKKISDENWLNSLKRQMGHKEYIDVPEKKSGKKPIIENNESPKLLCPPLAKASLHVKTRINTNICIELD